MRVFALTGAGVSAESGLGTFRDPDGLWERHDPRRLATPEAFAADPVLVHRFYDWRRRTALSAEPNAAHAALARLERGLAARGGALFLCTQNVDDLHERGGSARVHHLHGELFRARCLGCGTASDWRGDMGPADLGVEARCPACAAARLRPDIVWFGEMPRGLDAVARELRAADLFVAIGTSGAVYPAAGFVAEARSRGVPTLEINLGAADNAGLFDRAAYGRATEAVPAWVDEVLGRAA